MGTQTPPPPPPPPARQIIDVPEFELRILRREIKKLKRENAELKDGVIYFSREMEVNALKIELIINRYRSIFKDRIRLKRELAETLTRITSYTVTRNNEEDKLKSCILELNSKLEDLSEEVKKKESVEARLKSVDRSRRRSMWMLFFVVSVLVMGYATEHQNLIRKGMRLGTEHLRCAGSHYGLALSCAK